MNAPIEYRIFLHLHLQALQHLFPGLQPHLEAHAHILQREVHYPHFLVGFLALVGDFLAGFLATFFGAAFFAFIGAFLAATVFAKIYSKSEKFKF